MLNLPNLTHICLFESLLFLSGEPFPKEITWYKKTGQAYEGLYNGTIGNYVYTIGYYGDMYVQNPDKSSSGFYKIQVNFWPCHP